MSAFVVAIPRDIHQQGVTYVQLWLRTSSSHLSGGRPLTVRASPGKPSPLSGEWRRCGLEKRTSMSLPYRSDALSRDGRFTSHKTRCPRRKISTRPPKAPGTVPHRPLAGIR